MTIITVIVEYHRRFSISNVIIRYKRKKILLLLLRNIYYITPTVSAHETKDPVVKGLREYYPPRTAVLLPEDIEGD